MENFLERQMNPGELADLQGQLFQSTRMAHSNVQKDDYVPKRPVWMHSELLTELKHKKEVQRREKQG